MKKWVLILFFGLLFFNVSIMNLNAQCSICTKTASQLGVKPAKGLNVGILYLMLTPLAVAGYLGFRWWRREQEIIKADEAS